MELRVRFIRIELKKMYFLPLPCCLTRSADQFLVSGTKYDIGRLVVIWARDLNWFSCFTFPSAQRTVERFVNHHIFATIQALQSQKYLRSFQNPVIGFVQEHSEQRKVSLWYQIQSFDRNSRFSFSKIITYFFLQLFLSGFLQILKRPNRCFPTAASHLNWC